MKVYITKYALTRGILEAEAEVSSPASKYAMLAQLGDFFHAEDDKQVTPTAGHKLDVDGRAGKVTEIGFNLIRTLRVQIGLLEGVEDFGVRPYLAPSN